MDSRCSSIDSRPTVRGLWSVSSTPLSARVESYEAVEKKCISDVRRTFCLFVTFDLLFITLVWIIELNVTGGVQGQLEKEVLHYDFQSSFFDIFLLAVFRFAALILAYAICKLRHWWAVAVYCCGWQVVPLPTYREGLKAPPHRIGSHQITTGEAFWIFSFTLPSQLLTTAVSCAFLIVKVILTKLLSQETTGAFGYLLPIVSFILAWIETWLLDFKVLPQEAEEENRYQSFVDAADHAPLMGPGPVSDGQFYSPPESLADSDEDLEDKHDPEKGLIHQVS